MPRPHNYAICSVDGCDREVECNGLCKKDYERARRHSGVLAPPIPQSERNLPTGPDHHAWKGDDVGYFAAHARVQRARGAASEYYCEHEDETCKGPMDWANLSGNYGDVMDYIPLCRSHHVRFDVRALGSRKPNAKLTEAKVIEARQRYGSVTIDAMAIEYGVSGVALSNAIHGRSWKHVPGRVG